MTTNVSARRGIQSVEIAFRILSALQTSVRALPLKEIAALSDLSPSATSNYMISLVRTGLVSPDEKPGCYKLGPASLALGMSAINQLDGFDVVRREVIALRDATLGSAAVTAWTDDGPVSLFKQEGETRSILELRTGLIPLVTTAAGKLFIACLQANRTDDLIAREMTGERDWNAAAMREEASAELREQGFTKVFRGNLGYVSVAAPIWDRDGNLQFAISLIGTPATLDTDTDGKAIKALLDSSVRATVALGGKVSRPIG
ncbi:IclR family transcriptional regulator [Paraburkholderia bannensis]|uniref:IclR family transcriptional regulator n=1 Tax=Paraburkholderia bannensis TaxID=765414 RepID=UPI002AC317E2|nr:helix-turn-helix domain-containing protein [Paraburkholderia bannensis]